MAPLTPLVDVVMLLLFFMIMTSHFDDTQGLPVNLPAAANTQAAPLRPVIITLTADGAASYQGDAADFPEIRDRLLAETPSGVVIRADRTTPVETFVRLLDILREAEIPGTTIATETATESARFTDGAPDRVKDAPKDTGLPGETSPPASPAAP